MRMFHSYGHFHRFIAVEILLSFGAGSRALLEEKERSVPGMNPSHLCSGREEELISKLTGIFLSLYVSPPLPITHELTLIIFSSFLSEETSSRQNVYSQSSCTPELRRKCIDVENLHDMCPDSRRLQQYEINFEPHTDPCPVMEKNGVGSAFVVPVSVD